MLRAFRWNLRVLSYISLVVGAFLIYNTISVSVVRRRPEIGILRALGTARLGDPLAVPGGGPCSWGWHGSVLGLLLGRLLAQGAVGLICRTVNALYTSSRPGRSRSRWMSGGQAMRRGYCWVWPCLLRAFAPAREAMG